MNRNILIGILVVGALLLLAAVVVYVAFPPEVGPKDINVTLPPSLEELAAEYPHLAGILEDPELGSVYKEFLVVYEEEGEEGALEMARQRGIVVKNAEDGKEYVRATLVLDTEDHGALVEELEGVGVVVVSAYQDRVSVAIPLDMVLDELASDDPGAVFSQLTQLEHVIAVRLPEQQVPSGSDIEGEGVAVIEAKAWHQAGITGAGVRVGVLDGGFDGYEDLLGEELPDEVAFEQFGWQFDEDAPWWEKVHGTACAEIIHELAPDAELVLAQYDGSEAAFGEAVEWLVEEQDVDIISHSAGWMIGPRDGSEWTAQVVDQVAAEGVLWVNAAGNEALSHHRSTFTDDDGDGKHEFVPGEEALEIYSYGDMALIILSWEDDWERPVLDYQMYLYDRQGDLLASSRESQTGEEGEWPVEGFVAETEGDTVYVVIEAEDADRAVPLDLFVMGGEVAHPSADHSISPPGDAFHSLTVGAVNWEDDSLAEYSSQGPTTDGRLKPEISAPTGVSGFSYGPADEDGFTGTSAACPHVAGTAALVWQANPAFTRQQVVDYMLDNALNLRDLGPTGPDTGFGYGRLQLPAPGAVGPTPEPTETPPPPGDTPTPGPKPTVAPLPTPTPVTFITPTPGPPPPPKGPGVGTGMLVIAGVSVLVLGLGCGGGGLFFIGLLGLLILGRRSRRSRPRPVPRRRVRPRPQAPPSHPEPPPAASPPGQAPQPQAGPSQMGPSTMDRCRHCGASVRPGVRFCAACGRPLARYCRHCGAGLREGVRFCASCGKPVE